MPPATLPSSALTELWSSGRFADFGGAGVLDGDRDGPACRMCGCVQERACLAGCDWVPDPLRLGALCSACLRYVPSAPADLVDGQAG
ncbi:hypothetical protein [Nonomuraea endophytica]|uniref:hypothetical protein n=1 Tax=Nonomuraea endophytica TaxID=714136 RepID=UPI0037C92A56